MNTDDKSKVTLLGAEDGFVCRCGWKVVRECLGVKVNGACVNKSGISNVVNCRCNHIS